MRTSCFKGAAVDMGIEPTFWQGLEHPSLKICRPECNPGALERSSGHVGPPQTQASLECCFPISFFKDSLQIDFLKRLTICCLPADLQPGQNALFTVLPGTNCSEIHEIHENTVFRFGGGY